MTTITHIIETNPVLASVTNISAVSSETDTTVITIGHLDEVHYVSTVPFNEQAMAFNVICNNQPLQLAIGCCRTTNNNETIAAAKEQKRKAYLKEYMATRGRNNEFRISKTEHCKERDQKILKKNKIISKAGI